MEMRLDFLPHPTGSSNVDLSNQDLQALRALERVMDVLCTEMDKSAPLHQGLVFLAAARANVEGELATTKDLQERTKLSSAAISRIIGALQEVKFTGKRGLELLRVKMDYSDRRRRPLMLTEKGEGVVKKLLEAL